MKKLKSGFTLIEIIIVLLLLGILIIAFKRFFEPKNQNDLYAQSCINIVHGEVENFINAGMTSKNLYSDETSIEAEKYLIYIDENNDSITLAFQTGTNNTGMIKSYNLSGGTPSNFYCSSPQYNVRLSGGDSRSIVINKGFISENESPFLLKKGENRYLTGNSIFKICNKAGDTCKEIALRNYDSRAKNITKKLCLSYTGNNNNICNKRDK